MNTRWPKGLLTACTAMAALALLPRTSPAAVTIDFIEIDLRGAIRMAIQKNFRLEEERYVPKIASQELRAQSGKFDPILELSYTYDSNVQELRTLNTNLEDPTPLPGEVLPDLFARTSGSEYDAGLGGLTPWGLTYDLGASVTADDDNRRSFTRYESFLGVGITQPLLRNFGTDVNMASIRIARANQKISEWGLREQLIDVVTECIRVYSELCFAIENLAVEVRARELAARLVRDNLRRAEIGVMAPLDVLQARADLAAREGRVLVAERAVADNENFLKQLITDEISGLLDLRVRPLPPRIPDTPRPDLERDLVRAFELRPDYRQALLELQKRKINVVFERNQALPRLDIVSSFGLNGIDTDFGESVSRVLGQDNQNLAWDIGAIFSVPIPNREGTANREIASLETARSIIGLKRLEQQIIVEADNSAGQIETTAKRIEASRLARLFAAETLAAAQKRLASGTATTFEVLQFQRDLTTAEADELRSIADHIIAIAEYARDTGTTLERNSVIVQGAQ